MVRCYGVRVAAQRARLPVVTKRPKMAGEYRRSSTPGESMKKFAIVIAALLAASTAAIAQTSVSPSEAQSRPENMAVGPDGTLYIGSQKDARIYRARPGQAVAQPFIDMRPSALVLGVLADGASNLQIAGRLSLSESTVKFHLRNIFSKLGVTNRTEAAARYHRRS